jgi:hypothetical protein
MRDGDRRYGEGLYRKPKVARSGTARRRWHFPQGGVCYGRVMTLPLPHDPLLADG